MTASELKYRVEQSGNEPHFFTRRTMKFFGDTMSNYGVRNTFIVSQWDADGNYIADGIRRQVWELWRKRPVYPCGVRRGLGLRNSAYFCPFTFKRVFEMRGAK